MKEINNIGYDRDISRVAHRPGQASKCHVSTGFPPLLIFRRKKFGEEKREKQRHGISRGEEDAGGGDGPQQQAKPSRRIVKISSAKPIQENHRPQGRRTGYDERTVRERVKIGFEKQ